MKNNKKELTIEEIEYQLLMAMQIKQDNKHTCSLMVDRLKDGTKVCSILFNGENEVRIISFHSFDSKEEWEAKLQIAIDAIHGDEEVIKKAKVLGEKR